MTLRQELDAIRNEPDTYLFHEHLEDINEAFYFHQFAEAAKQYGLEYLAEADIGDMLVSNFPPKVAETLRRVATDIVRMEQYIDFVRNRMFRQTLLVHQGASLRRTLDGNMLKGMQIASAVRAQSAQPVLTQGASEAFKTPGGVTHNIVDALTKAALVLLQKQWPGCLPFEELAAMSRASLRQNGGAAIVDDNDRSFGDRMLQGYAVRAVELRVHPPRLALVVSARPVASPLARLQSEQGSLAVTNLRHEPVKLNELPRRMLPFLDGTRDIDAITVDLVKLAKAGKIGVRERDGGPVVTDDAALARILRQAVESSLPDMVQVALLLE
jgi:methyltransferase-like protein